MWPVADFVNESTGIYISLRVMHISLDSWFLAAFLCCSRLNLPDWISFGNLHHIFCESTYPTFLFVSWYPEQVLKQPRDASSIYTRPPSLSWLHASLLLSMELEYCCHAHECWLRLDLQLQCIRHYYGVYITAQIAASASLSGLESYPRCFEGCHTAPCHA